MDRDDPNHNRCLNATQLLPNQPMLTTWCCFTEAMYFLGKIDGHTAQAKLWEWVFSGDLELHSLSTFEIARMSELMKKYADTPMDLADASLMVVAESRNIQQILTLDSDFHVYRKADRTALQCLP